ncbi:hypothetical protein PoB_003797700 [Plakobranchus ocellatus]|uniref:Uncharacterized protein n=1 Tax=Plakobranchus ocellatus TaxID=259542 RepID=A0AAV4AWP5_9GAST|nr:hypothetical protein PoB_003797700 [Plakobranchus ocellatus]
MGKGRGRRRRGRRKRRRRRRRMRRRRRRRRWWRRRKRVEEEEEEERIGLVWFGLEARASVAELEPATEWSLQISGRTC